MFSSSMCCIYFGLRCVILDSNTEKLNTSHETAYLISIILLDLHLTYDLGDSYPEWFITDPEPLHAINEVTKDKYVYSKFYFEPVLLPRSSARRCPGFNDSSALL